MYIQRERERVKLNHMFLDKSTKDPTFMKKGKKKKYIWLNLKVVTLTLSIVN